MGQCIMGGTCLIGVPLHRHLRGHHSRGDREWLPVVPRVKPQQGMQPSPCPVGLEQPGVGLLPQFPLAGADGCLGSPLTPRAGGCWPWAPLALMMTDVGQPGEKRDHSGAEPAVPPGRVRIWPLCGSNVAPSMVVPCRWSRASLMPLAPCSQRSTKRGPRGGFSLPDVCSPPGTPQAVSQWAEVRGRRGPAPAGADDASLPHLWWHGSPCLHQLGWGCCSCWPPAPLAEQLLGGPKSPLPGWPKCPPGWPKSPQDGQNLPEFFWVERSVVFACCRSSLPSGKAEWRLRMQWI